MRERLLGWLYRLWGWLPFPFWLRWPIIWLGSSKFLIGVSAVILNERAEVLLFRHTYRGKEPWGLPGGWLKQHEDPARAVEREIREEAGLEVRVMQPVWTQADPRRARVDIIFSARLVGGEFRPSPEVCEAAYFSSAQAPFAAEDRRNLTQMVALSRALEDGRVALFPGSAGPPAEPT